MHPLKHSHLLVVLIASKVDRLLAPLAFQELTFQLEVVLPEVISGIEEAEIGGVVEG